MKDQRLQVAMLVGEIMTLASMVNQFTKFCAFVRFSGHVDQISVDIASSKEEFTETKVSGSAYTGSDEDDDRYSIETLNKLKYRLKKILRENEIDYSKLNYEVEEVRHYKLV